MFRKVFHPSQYARFSSSVTTFDGNPLEAIFSFAKERTHLSKSPCSPIVKYLQLTGKNVNVTSFVDRLFEIMKLMDLENPIASLGNGCLDFFTVPESRQGTLFLGAVTLLVQVP